jgi:glycerate dehydrogenase
MNTQKDHHHIVILDSATLNPGDLSWEKMEAMASCEIYEHSTAAEVVPRARKATIILVNKVIINEEVMSQLPKLACICVTATGYNNIDLQAASRRNIPVCNAVGYSTDAVAQHVMALVLAFTNKVQKHSDSVHQGDWATHRDFSYTLSPIMELAGKTMGIYGFGRIGQRTAEIAMAFGMNILATHKHPRRDARPGVTFVSLEKLFEQSDVISLHAPLSANNKEIVNAQLLSRMKPTAYLINTGRGGLINEQDLSDALKKSQLAGAALDVLSQEPPAPDHPLLTAPNCIITPHNAWASQEARQRLMEIALNNLYGFMEGKPQNVVNQI